MSIRLEAAQRLARKMLELRPIPRLEPLSPKFIETMAKMIIVYVDLDEQAQRSEEILAGMRDIAAIENTSKEK